MKYITALLVALVAMFGIAGAVVDNNNVAAAGNMQDGYNSAGVTIITNDGGYNGYPYWDPYWGYGGAGYTNVNVNIDQDVNNFNNQFVSQTNVDVGGQDGADGADGADGQDGANGADGKPATAPVVAPQVAVAPNGMQIVNGGASLQEAQMEVEKPLEYVTYMDYNVLVVETRGLTTDVMQRFSAAAFAEAGYKAVYFVQGVLFYADGTSKNTTLDLSSPPRVARSLGYL